MDVLSEVLAICRSERAVTAHFALTAPWGLQSGGVSGALIRLVRGERYWLQLDAEAGQPGTWVEAGDLVMLPLGAPHSIRSGPGVAVTPFAQLIKTHATGARDESPLVFPHGGGGALTDMYSAQVWFSAYCRHSVFRILPPLIHIRASEMAMASSLGMTMEALVTETLAKRPGWRVSAGRMGELLLVNILRDYLGKTSALGEGWLRGLGDPSLARALAGMHQRPAFAWTLEALASEAGMSRTRFSERFKQLVGMAPISYLTSHRMALAAEQLEAGALTLGRIAESAGYESDKVFARAFRRWAGMTPKTYVQQESARKKQLDLARVV